MSRTIIFNGKSFAVLDVYAFKYNYGEEQEVLRIKISKNQHSYSEIGAEFEDIQTDIEHYEDGALVNCYSGYSKDFKCNYANGEFDIELTKATLTEKEILIIKSDVDKINNEIFPVPDKTDINSYKQYLVSESKRLLAAYLQKHPMLYTDEKYYSVTKDKQDLLTSNITAYQLEVQLGVTSPILEWNASGEPCSEWTIEELSVLAITIKNYVKPFVSYQQAKEVEINACTSIEELDLVEIDYTSLVIE